MWFVAASSLCVGCCRLFGVRWLLLVVVCLEFVVCS